MEGDPDWGVKHPPCCWNANEPDPTSAEDLRKYGYPFKLQNTPRQADFLGFISRDELCQVRAASMRHDFLPGLGSSLQRAAPRAQAPMAASAGRSSSPSAPTRRRSRRIGFGSGLVAPTFERGRHRHRRCMMRLRVDLISRRRPTARG